MGRGPLAFKATDVARAMKAAHSTGIKIVRTEIKPDGRIVFYHLDTNETDEPERLSVDEWWSKNIEGAS